MLYGTIYFYMYKPMKPIINNLNYKKKHKKVKINVMLRPSFIFLTIYNQNLYRLSTKYTLLQT